MSNFITFSLNGQIMGILVNHVEKIMNLTSVTKVPNSENYIEGVISYQDEIIPAINLKELLKLDSIEIEHSDLQVIVLNYKDKKAGIIVDEVKEIEEMDTSNPYLKSSSQYIVGTIKLRDEIINLINPEILSCVN